MSCTCELFFVVVSIFSPRNCSHDDNGSRNAPGVNSMKKELPAAYSKLQLAFRDYSTYTGGGFAFTVSVDSADQMKFQVSMMRISQESQRRHVLRSSV